MFYCTPRRFSGCPACEPNLFTCYNAANEQAAYGVGAAALVPYETLFIGIMDGATPESIAKQYRVSAQLVSYRIKITMLWDAYKRKAARAAG